MSNLFFVFLLIVWYNYYKVFISKEYIMSDENNEVQSWTGEVTLIWERENLDRADILLEEVRHKEHENHEARRMAFWFSIEDRVHLAEELDKQEKQNGTDTLTFEEKADIVLKKGKELWVVPKNISTISPEWVITNSQFNSWDQKKKYQLEALNLAKPKITKALWLDWLWSSIKKFLSSSVELAFKKKLLWSEDFNKKHPTSWLSPFDMIGQFLKISFWNIITGMSPKVSNILNWIANISAPSISQSTVTSAASTTAATVVAAWATVWATATTKTWWPILKTVVEWAWSAAETVVETAEDLTQWAKEFVGMWWEKQTPKKQEAQKVKIDTIEKYIGERPKYLFWSKILLWLSNEKQEKNVDQEIVLKWLENKTYSELYHILWPNDQRETILWNSASKEQQNMLETVVKGFLSINTKRLLGFQMKQPHLRNTIRTQSNEINEGLIPYFIRPNETDSDARERLGILATAHDTIEWENYTVKELSTLYLQWIPVLRLPRQNEWLSSISWKWLGFLSQWILPKELDSINGDEVFPSDIINGILTSYNWPSTIMGWKDLMYTVENSAFRTKVLSKIDPKNITHLDALINFKEKIFNSDEKATTSSSFLHHPKLNLTQEQKYTFKNNLNYKWIIWLYWVLGWNPDLNEINPVNLPILVWLIWEIIASWSPENEKVAFEYTTSYAKTAVMWNTENMLSQEEKEIFDIYEEKIIDLVLIAHIREFYKILWISLGVFWLSVEWLAIGSWVWWVLSYLYGKRHEWKWLDKKQLRTLRWTLAKRTWVVWMLSWAILGWASYYGKDSLWNRWESEVSKALEEGNIKKVKELIKKHEQALTQYTNSEWENFAIYAYPGEPVVVFYKQKLYFPTIIDDMETLEWTDYLTAFWERVMAWALFTSDKTTRTIGAKSVDTEQTSFTWDDVILWGSNWNIQISIHELQKKISTQNIRVNKWAINKLEENLLNDRDIPFSGDPENYIPLKNLDKGKIFALKEAWEIKTPE